MFEDTLFSREPFLFLKREVASATLLLSSNFPRMRVMLKGWFIKNPSSPPPRVS